MAILARQRWRLVRKNKSSWDEIGSCVRGKEGITSDK